MLLYTGYLAYLNRVGRSHQQDVCLFGFFLRGSQVQTWDDLDCIWSPTELTCDHNCTKCLQAVKRVLNTHMWEAQWILGIFPLLLLTRGRRVNLGVNKRLKELASPQQLRLHSQSCLLIRPWMASMRSGDCLNEELKMKSWLGIICPLALTCLQMRLQPTLAAFTSTDQGDKWDVPQRKF